MAAHFFTIKLNTDNLWEKNKLVTYVIVFCDMLVDKNSEFDQKVTDFFVELTTVRIRSFWEWARHKPPKIGWQKNGGKGKRLVGVKLGAKTSRWSFRNRNTIIKMGRPQFVILFEFTSKFVDLNVPPF